MEGEMGKAPTTMKMVINFKGNGKMIRRYQVRTHFKLDKNLKANSRMEKLLLAKWYI